MTDKKRMCRTCGELSNNGSVANNWFYCSDCRPIEKFNVNGALCRKCGELSYKGSYKGSRRSRRFFCTRCRPLPDQIAKENKRSELDKEYIKQLKKSKGL